MDLLQIYDFKLLRSQNVQNKAVMSGARDLRGRSLRGEFLSPYSM
jgi:hypothetical protein